MEQKPHALKKKRWSTEQCSTALYLADHQKTARPLLVAVQKANRNYCGHDTPTKPVLAALPHYMLISKTHEQWQNYKKNNGDNYPTSSAECNTVNV